MRDFFPFKDGKLKNHHQHCTASLNRNSPKQFNLKAWDLHFGNPKPHTSVVQQAMSKPFLHLENKWLKGDKEEKKAAQKRIIYSCSKSEQHKRLNRLLLQSNLIEPIHSELNFWTFRIFRKSRTLNKNTIRHFTMKIDILRQFISLQGKLLNLLTQWCPLYKNARARLSKLRDQPCTKKRRHLGMWPLSVFIPSSMLSLLAFSNYILITLHLRGKLEAENISIL